MICFAWIRLILKVYMTLPFLGQFPDVIVRHSIFSNAIAIGVDMSRQALPSTIEDILRHCPRSAWTSSHPYRWVLTGAYHPPQISSFITWEG